MFYLPQCKYTYITMWAIPRAFRICIWKSVIIFKVRGDQKVCELVILGRPNIF